MNKNIVTNGIAILLMVIGHFMQWPILFAMGLFAFSGAITNWVAVHMLFEKVPGLYGSGVIPTHFEEFKTAISKLMMEQFFTTENINRFIEQAAEAESHVDLEPVIESVDFSIAFESLVEAVQESSFGSMLGMFGGVKALEPMREPFIKRLRSSLLTIANQEEFQNKVREQLSQSEIKDETRDKIAAIIDQRLNELTPEMVKSMVQDIIKKHLGWLVVWGGVFGGLIGLLSQLVIIYL